MCAGATFQAARLRRLVLWRRPDPKCGGCWRRGRGFWAHPQCTIAPECFRGHLQSQEAAALLRDLLAGAAVYR